MAKQRTCDLQNRATGASLGVVSLTDGIEAEDIEAALKAGTVLVVDRPKPKPAMQGNHEPLGTV